MNNFPRHSYTAGGSLYVESPKLGTIVRANHYGHCQSILSTFDLRRTLRAGRYTSVGSYPVYLITDDGAALCWECCTKEYKQVSTAIRERSRGGWRVIACQVNYEDDDLLCDHCSKAIESAYGDNHAQI